MGEVRSERPRKALRGSTEYAEALLDFSNVKYWCLSVATSIDTTPSSDQSGNRKQEKYATRGFR